MITNPIALFLLDVLLIVCLAGMVVLFLCGLLSLACVFYRFVKVVLKGE